MIGRPARRHGRDFPANIVFQAKLSCPRWQLAEESVSAENCSRRRPTLTREAVAKWDRVTFPVVSGLNLSSAP
ncbi:hypothetical protein EKH55_4083 [Sinorhizobium alkalisoli]|nr:hypothetical protein EKH55_4083 [Sinorhizobium alkalisoli]